MPHLETQHQTSSILVILTISVFHSSLYTHCINTPQAGFPVRLIPILYTCRVIDMGKVRLESIVRYNLWKTSPNGCLTSTKWKSCSMKEFVFAKPEQIAFFPMYLFIADLGFQKWNGEIKINQMSSVGWMWKIPIKNICEVVWENPSDVTVADLWKNDRGVGVGGGVRFSALIYFINSICTKQNGVELFLLRLLSKLSLAFCLRKSCPSSTE